MKNYTQDTIGTIYGILAFTFWGFVPIYFKLVGYVNVFEVLSHRILWSVLFLLLFLFIGKSFKNLLSVIRNKKKIKILFMSALLMSTNWLIYIWAVTNNKIVEISLGYFISPLLTVFLGYLFFKEKISKYQLIAIFLAFIGIMYQVYSIGELPIVSIAIATIFALYGFTRKKVNVESVSGLLIETVLVAPFALIYFLYLVSIEQNAFNSSFDSTTLLLILSGLITIIPLIWFTSAATKISMVKLGFLQYIAPSISFLLAIFIYNEPLNKDSLITFVFIWIALFIFSFSSIKQRKKKLS